MWDFMFTDIESGEDFFVECKNLSEALEIINENFGNNAKVRYLGRYSVEYAEALGLDTY